MPSPQSSMTAFGAEVYTSRAVAGGVLTVSPDLAALLVQARNTHAWRGSPRESQKRILDLVADAVRPAHGRSAVASQQLIARIAKWDGGRGDSALAGWSDAQREQARSAVNGLRERQANQQEFLDFAALPGIGMVLATKVYRFLSPQTAAAADRHSSYFSNSLAIQHDDGTVEMATDFRREWTSPSRAGSRWAVYEEKETQVREYLERYLPLLGEIAAALNAGGYPYRCAWRGVTTDWLPADVEMAMDFWWSKHGPR